MQRIPEFSKFTEQRKGARIRLYYPAHIVMGNGLPNRSCILRDICRSGGRISAEEIRDVPDRFVLWLSPDGRVTRLCQTQWRFDNQIGVQFLKKSISAHPLVPRSDVELIFI